MSTNRKLINILIYCRNTLQPFKRIKQLQICLYKQDIFYVPVGKKARDSNQKRKRYVQYANYLCLNNFIKLHEIYA